MTLSRSFRHLPETALAATIALGNCCPRGGIGGKDSRRRRGVSAGPARGRSCVLLLNNRSGNDPEPLPVTSCAVSARVRHGREDDGVTGGWHPHEMLELAC
jgi:hypothetical protein